ncbi:MAG: helix-turn-helix domain-containing protein [Pseudomonadota bacterium]
MEAALLLFRGHGYHGVGINDILKSASLPKGSLYHHSRAFFRNVPIALVEPRFYATKIIANYIT